MLIDIGTEEHPLSVDPHSVIAVEIIEDGIRVKVDKSHYIIPMYGGGLGEHVRIIHEKVNKVCGKGDDDES